MTGVAVEAIMKETMGIITENAMKVMSVMRTMKIITNLPVNTCRFMGIMPLHCTASE